MVIELASLAKVFPDLNACKGQVAEVRGLMPLALASPKEAAFYLSDRYRQDLAQTRAGVVITSLAQFPYVSEDFSGTIWDTSDPVSVISHIGNVLEAERFGCDEQWSEPGVHPTAVVERGAIIHPDACVGPYCVVRRGAIVEAFVSVLAHVYVGCHTHLKERCRIGPHVVILAHTVIGKGAYVMGGVVLGSKGFGVQRDSLGKNCVLPQLGNVVLEEDVWVGANTNIDRGSFGPTYVGDRTCLDGLIKVGHNVVMGSDVIMCGQSGVGGSVTLGDRVTLAAQAGIKDHVSIASGVQVAARGGVMRNISAPDIAVGGAPAQPVWDWMRIESVIRRLPELLARITSLEQRLSRLETRSSSESSSVSEENEF